MRGFVRLLTLQNRKWSIIIMAQSAQPYQCAHFQQTTTIRFCPNVAAAIGVSEAIIIYRLDYWLGRTKHRFDGRAWVVQHL
jgi:hypothetical protein